MPLALDDLGELGRKTLRALAVLQAGNRREIAEQSGLTKSQTSSALTRLENFGLVTVPAQLGGAWTITAAGQAMVTGQPLEPAPEPASAAEPDAEPLMNEEPDLIPQEFIPDALTRNREIEDAFVQAQRRAGRANSTINLRLAMIKAVLNSAVEWGWLEAAPRHKALPAGERRLRWLTRDEAARLVAELPPHLAAMARFSLATGLRESNVCRLEWNQVDLDRRTGWIHGDQAKSRRPIAIPLNADAMVVLREQQGQHPRWVFPYQGRPLRRANNEGFQAAVKRAGLDGLRWHDLRHTWASWHVQAGTPLAVLKELGGWASLTMVLRYAHLSTEHLADHADRIAGPRLVRTNSGTPAAKSAATG